MPYCEWNREIGGVGGAERQPTPPISKYPSTDYEIAETAERTAVMTLSGIGT
jgi:hypothetical protein